jgi:serine protease Do
VVTVFRRGASKDLSVLVAEVEPEKPARKASAAEAKPPIAGPAQSMGLMVSELPEPQKKELKLKGGVKVDAAEGSAARAGLREGDVIVAIGNVEILSLKDFEAAIAKADKNKVINMQFRRGELAQFALIRPAR